MGTETGELPAVESEGLTKRFPPIRKGLAGLGSLWEQIRGEAQTITALEDVSFQVKEGEIFGLLGPNGAGKTTFCKILNALVVPTAGCIRVRGQETVKHHHEIARRMVTIFGGESDLFGLFTARLSCEKNLEFVGDLWGLPRKVTRQRVEEALEWLDLQEKRTEWYQKLSGGTKQRLFLCIPLILRRGLVILDEPTIRMDVPGKRKVQDLLKRVLNKELGSTILLTTHDLAEAERLCDRIGILKKGRMVLVDTPKGLHARSRYSEVVRLKLKPGTVDGDDDGSVRDALAKIGPDVNVESDPDSDGTDGLRGYVLRTPRTENGEGPVLPAVLSCLSENGLSPVSISVTEPSLEEIFMDLVGEDEPDGKEEASS